MNSKRNPEAGHELRGRLTHLGPIAGAYRIIYEPRGNKTVRVVPIRHRGQTHDTDLR